MAPSTVPTPRPSASLVIVNERNEILLARHAIHQQRLLFQTFLESQNLKADGGSSLPFTQWITPVGPWKLEVGPFWQSEGPVLKRLFEFRRFHTQFYTVFLPAAPSSGFSSGAKQERIPKHDGGQEVIEAWFMHPGKALEEYCVTVHSAIMMIINDC
ncbi:hypothetical protein BDZ97DRAFT_1820331 [Flammula alnicola]|nr:hypothetical protein BDZ97DRAFT_1820331 [Flammula alnicola]